LFWSRYSGRMSAILKKFRRRKDTVPPVKDLIARFEVRERFLSDTELEFLRLLCESVGDKAIVCPKPRVLETLRILNAHWHLEDALRVDRKHIDFLVCDSTTGKPLCAVQIQWWNEQQGAYRPQEQLLDQAFRVAGLPVTYVPSNQLPTVSEMRQQIEDLIGTVSDGRILQDHRLDDPVPPTEHAINLNDKR